ncbi:hypothetical protein Dthio_PD3388 [Desulfonatronospira thiodismutans ASO3-1]|uniref:Uncharacterized protein n=1 Tax=Desulfonatronospira thiodismutans ASO3-1 TaxID=555779 RepID=D6SMN5_9BACT|nr:MULTISPECIES: hypothetical protein [Desulfonatronospira]EFI35946.1 hypothetical protein Dthio_PD3388 [Desulfonatronospira thiodismutans ASO3-1]RQD79297.1 MAG: hypothetical protein D5S03_00390 [Desulfonatronospira sp. MSAO_Bac3]
MSGFSGEKLVNSIKTAVLDRQKKLQENMPEIERNLYHYAGKMGIKPEDIQRTRDRIKDRIHKARKKD